MLRVLLPANTISTAGAAPYCTRVRYPRISTVTFQGGNPGRRCVPSREFLTAAAAASWLSFFPHAAGPALSSSLPCLSAHSRLSRWHGSLLPLHTGTASEPIHWLVMQFSEHTVRCFAMLACSALLWPHIGQDAGSAEEILLRPAPPSVTPK